MQTIPAQFRDGTLLAARLLLGAIFVQSGFGKLTNLPGFIATIDKMGAPLPQVLGPLGACVEFFGGLALVLGAWTWVAALLVALFTLSATWLAHRFWTYPPEQQTLQHIQFMKNLAIIGGLLALATAGAGRISVDGARMRKKDIGRTP